LGVPIAVLAAALASGWSIASSAVLVVLVIEAAEAELALEFYRRESARSLAG